MYAIQLSHTIPYYPGLSGHPPTDEHFVISIFSTISRKFLSYNFFALTNTRVSLRSETHTHTHPGPFPIPSFLAPLLNSVNPQRLPGAQLLQPQVLAMPSDILSHSGTNSTRLK